MSVDPASPSASEPGPPKPGPTASPHSENAADPLELAKGKKRFKKGVGGAETEEEEKPDQAIELVSSLLQDLIAKKEQRVVPEAETRTAKYHRLAKSARPVGGSSEVTSADLSTPDPGASAPVSPAVAPPPPGFRPAEVFVSAEDRRRARWRKVLYTLTSLVLAAGAFYAGYCFASLDLDPSPAGKRPVVAVKPPASAWTDPQLAQLDQVLAADQAGDLENANRSAEVLSSPAGVPPGLDLYRTTLATRRAHINDAEADLTRLLNVSTSPLGTAAVNERMAFNSSRNRDFEKASESLAAAARLDPFSASVFYRWGEALRHVGRLDEAVARFRQTLLRIPVGQPEAESLRACTEFKLRLALIEAGRDAEVQPDLDERLKAAAPSGYWLLTAAAIALQHKDLTEAASFLGRARETLGVEQFDALLNDYFFRSFFNPVADRKGISEYFPADPVARRAKLEPSMAYSIDP